MKKRMTAVLLCLVMMAAAVLGGCKKEEPVTAEGLIEEAKANMEDVESVKGNFDANMELGTEIPGGGDMKVDVDFGGDFEATKDPEIFSLDGHMGLSLLGLDMDMKMITERNGDEVTSYVNVLDQWQKETVPYTEKEIASMKDVYKIISGGSDISLKEEMEEVNEQSVYVITAKIDAASLMQIMESMNLAPGDSVPEEMKNVDINMTVKIYEESRRPAAVTIQTGGIEIGDKASGTDMRLNDCEISCIYSEYDTVEGIEIPQEAKDAEEGSADIMM